MVLIEIQVIGLQSLQRSLQFLPGAVPGSLLGFAGQEDLIADKVSGARQA